MYPQQKDFTMYNTPTATTLASVNRELRAHAIALLALQTPVLYAAWAAYQRAAKAALAKRGWTERWALRLGTATPELRALFFLDIEDEMHAVGEAYAEMAPAFELLAQTFRKSDYARVHTGLLGMSAGCGLMAAVFSGADEAGMQANAQEYIKHVLEPMLQDFAVTPA